MIDEIKSALPGAKNVTYNDGGIHFTMPNGAKVHVTIHDNMTVANEDAVRRAHGIKQGITITVNGAEHTVGSEAFIELSRVGKKGSMCHELFHAVWDMALTDKEKAALTKAYAKEAQRTGRDLEEVCADKYRDWVRAKAENRFTNFGKLWQKIKNVLDGLRKAIAKTEDVQAIFSEIESGKVWERNEENSSDGADNEAEARYNKADKETFAKRMEDRHLLNRINDDMTLEDIRELFIVKEKNDKNRLVNLYERLNNRKDAQARLAATRKILKEALQMLNHIRRDFYDAGNLQRLSETLERGNKIREGSRLAQSV